MSWDKQTIVFSEIDSLVKVFKELEEPYKLETLGEVVGMGLNDSFEVAFDKQKMYPIRRLAYKDKVILEQMFRTGDCDSNDSLLSFKFKKEKEPKNWSLEKTFDDNGNEVKEKNNV